MAAASRRSAPRRLGLSGRAGVAVVAAGLGVLSPFAATPAAAQSAPAGSWATPPPMNGYDGLPSDTKAPDKPYEQKTDCVKRSLGENVQINSRPWGQDYLQLLKAQEIVRAAKGNVGGNQRVAVVDTGVTRHPWFQGRVEAGGDYVLPAPAGQAGLQDCDGHGTEVAGIIAGDPKDPKVGFIGVAPDARIVSYRQLSENYGPKDKNSSPTGGSQPPPSNGGGNPGGTGPQQGGNNGDSRQIEKGDTAGTLGSLAQIIRGIADRGDIGVINMSLDHCRAAPPADIQPSERQVQAAVKYATDKGVVIVAAAGNVSDSCPQNDQSDPNKPKSIVTPPWFSDDVLSVGAIDKDGSVASFSVHGPWIGVAAPGTEIVSLDPAENSTGLANRVITRGTQASPIQGTSFAAPYVAGVAALVRQMYPDLDARQVIKRIKTTAQHPAAPGGHDDYVGYGVIDPVAALTANLPGDVGNLATPNPVVQAAQLPPADGISSTPMIVALAGTGGGLAALLITLFVMHTIRRNRGRSTPPR
ncbi:membrane-anchored mycosin MYCP [Amycolatopsis sulphurea]|uniref:Membrane-anchored mycosin MYCP n=1 Tax=Amycolatopsis sulphurea TaxID=76022 RepID=A0A2A9FB02_9PSEU|nr:type VII secretion-associated serine protease mycosin [Amycolatopsis sulphurea]PFG47605.1 membrane-anchored mycosin MYCP [Amycolatopsis sulphurea]